MWEWIWGLIVGVGAVRCARRHHDVQQRRAREFARTVLRSARKKSAFPRRRKKSEVPPHHVGSSDDLRHTHPFAPNRSQFGKRLPQTRPKPRALSGLKLSLHPLRPFGTVGHIFGHTPMCQPPA